MARRPLRTEWSETRRGGFVEDEVFVHVEHLSAVAMDADENGAEKRNEPKDLYRVEDRPAIQLWKIIGEKEEPEQVSHSDETGVALERRIRAGEGYLAEANQ